MENGENGNGTMSTGRVFERLLALAGVLAFGRLVFHVASHWPALHGVQVWVQAHPELSVSERLWAFPSLVYGLFGAWRLVTTPALWRTAGYFAGSGVVCVLYAAAHVIPLYAVTEGPATSTRAIYEVLWVQAGQWPWLIAHVLGICAASLHVSLGLPRASAVLLGFRGDAARYLGIAVGLVLLFVQIELLSHFALGRPLVPVSSESESAETLTTPKSL